MPATPTVFYLLLAQVERVSRSNGIQCLVYRACHVFRRDEIVEISLSSLCPPDPAFALRGTRARIVQLTINVDN